VVLIGVGALLWAVIQNKPRPANATYSQFFQQVQAGQISKAIVLAAQAGANQVIYSLKDGSQVNSVLPSDYRDAPEAMQQRMVDIEIRDASTQWIRVLLNAGPFLVLLGFRVYIMRRKMRLPDLS
jgi:ATP-dependent Zn protease